MGLLDWSRRLLRLDDPGGWVGGGHLAGRAPVRPISPWAALQLGAVWSCVRVKSNTVGALPCSVMQAGINNEFKPLTGHPVYDLVHAKPNADQTATEFWRAAIAALDLWGNAYAEKVRAGDGTLTALNWLKPDRTRREKDVNGVVTFVHYDDAGHRVVFAEDDVWHIKGFTAGGELGLSAIQFGSRTLAVASETQSSVLSFFRNGMRAAGFFKSPIVLSDQQRKDFRANVIERHSGAENTATAGLLEGGFDWVAVDIKPQDAQLLESRRFDIEEICRWLDTPPILIGHTAAGQTMWGSGVEQIFSGWFTLVIQPLLVGIEQSANLALLTRAERQAGLFIHFNFDAILRADATARADFLTKLCFNAIMTRNEARAKENLPRSEEAGADKLTLQINMTTLEKLTTADPYGQRSDLIPPGSDPAPGDPLSEPHVPPLPGPPQPPKKPKRVIPGQTS